MSQPPIGSAGMDTLRYNENDLSIGSAGMNPPSSYQPYGQTGQSYQPYAQTQNRGPTIGSAGESTPHYTTDPSIGTAGEIPAQPRGRDFPNAPPIGSGGAQPTAGWNQNVGKANEGEESKHGFLYNLFHRK